MYIQSFNNIHRFIFIAIATVFHRRDEEARDILARIYIIKSL